MAKQSALFALSVFNLFTSSSAEYTKDVILRGNLNDGGVVKGGFQAVFNGPEVRYAWEIRFKKDYITSKCKPTPTCSEEVVDEGIKWSLRSKWNHLVNSAADEKKCMKNGGIYDPTFACGRYSRFGKHHPHHEHGHDHYGHYGHYGYPQPENNNTVCSTLRKEKIVPEKYKCSLKDNPLSCMMGDLAGKFGNMAVRKEAESYYLFKGKTGFDRFPPSSQNYCDREECDDKDSTPPMNLYGSLTISCPCGKILACMKLEVDKSKKTQKYEYAAPETGYGTKGYGDTGSGGYNSDGYDSAGYNADGYNTKGYNNDGYDMKGYDNNGYNSDGYDVDSGYQSKDYGGKDEKNAYAMDDYGYEDDYKGSKSNSEYGNENKDEYKDYKGSNEYKADDYKDYKDDYSNDKAYDSGNMGSHGSGTSQAHKYGGGGHNSGHGNNGPYQQEYNPTVKQYRGK